MTFDDWAKLVASIVAPAAAVIAIGGRQTRLRSHIRGNLELLKLISDDDLLAERTPARGWLQGKITVDLARLVGHQLGTPKRPVKWGSVVLAFLLFAGFGVWAYFLSKDGFVWYSVFPGLASLLFLISVFGQFMNREIPENERTIPAGATPLRSKTAQEQVATVVELASSGAAEEMFQESGQVAVSLSFVTAMSEGRFEDGLAFVDENWLACRLRSWLWNNKQDQDKKSLDRSLASLIESRAPTELWSKFVDSESQQFKEAWPGLSASSLGAASRRRRVSPDCDLVLLIVLNGSEGYYVTSATQVPGALPILVRRNKDGAWRVSNHLGQAPPVEGWPPTWWSTNDLAMQSLPD